MATVYTKVTKTFTNAADLLTKLSSDLVSAGYVQEAYVDNIISSVNLGKKLILSKNSTYYYLAASDNNAPSGNYTIAISKSISSIMGCCSKTLNSTNNWTLNGIDLNYVNAEFKPGSTYFLYYNDKNFIIVIKFAPNKYSTLMLGEIESDDDDVKIIQAGSCESGLSSSSTMYPKKPFLSPLQATQYRGLRCLSVGETTSVEELYINHFQDQGDFSYSGSNNNGYLYPKSFNIWNGVSALLPIDFMNRTTIRPVGWIDKLFVVNFANMTNEQTMELNTRTYDVYPFYEKSQPQNYGSQVNFGCGFAIKTSE